MTLAVRVRPSAGTDRVTGWLEDGSLKLDVAAAPEDGRANDAVVALLSRVVGVPRAAVRIAGGASSRRKRVEIEGAEPAEVKRRIDAALEGPKRGG